MVPLKYLSNFWKTPEIPLINCEISLQLKWSRNCVIITGTENNQNPSFQINDTKLYVSVVTLLNQENIKLLKQLESGFKRTINWNKYLAKTTNQARNRYLDYLIYSSFQGVNRLFLLSFEMMMVEKVTSNNIFQLWKWKIIMLWLMEEISLIKQ